MRLLLHLFFALGASLVSGPPFARAAERAAAHEHFDLVQAGRRITVWMFLPPGSSTQTPVVFVMHGVARDGERYLIDWIPLAREKKFLLVVPEFSKEQFVGVEGYIYGNTVDPAGRPLPREQWSFSAIEPVFDAVKARTGNKTGRYRLYGHSAGAQFVQRFVYFVPAARVERIVSANAGWYMLPDLGVEFPYGLKNTPVTEADLRHALALPMTVLLGTADTDPVLHALRHTPESDAQGPHRLARGKFFYARASESANKYQTEFGWRLSFAPDIDHDDARMAPFAARELFDR
jgi:poly(3-hydroxybutyrate) depolymerase